MDIRAKVEHLEAEACRLLFVQLVFVAAHVVVDTLALVIFPLVNYAEGTSLLMLRMQLTCIVHARTIA